MLEEKCVESSCITALPPPHSKYCKCKKNIENYWNIEQGNENEWVGWSRAEKLGTIVQYIIKGIVK